MTDLPSVRCNATINGKRCDWTGTKAELSDHAQESGHLLCRVCLRSLRNHENHCCGQCVNQTRDNLHLIIDACARMPAVAEATGYLNQPIPGGAAMVILAGGNIEGGGPDDHIDFHDPIDPLAVLEHNERDWRLIFGHGRGDDVATVEGCARYLLTWLQLAARTHGGFDDFVREVRTLAIRLTHTTGQANDPVKATAKCIDCQGTLISPYRGSPDIPDQVTRQGHRWEGREMRGDVGDEPEPVWECSRCSAVFNPIEYRLACRAAIEAQAAIAG